MPSRNADFWSSADCSGFTQHRGHIWCVSRPAAGERPECVPSVLCTLLVAFSGALLPRCVCTLPYGIPHPNLMLVAELGQRDFAGPVKSEQIAGRPDELYNSCHLCAACKLVMGA
jgi:hypothetical protein